MDPKLDPVLEQQLKKNREALEKQRQDQRIRGFPKSDR